MNWNNIINQLEIEAGKRLQSLSHDAVGQTLELLAAILRQEQARSSGYKAMDALIEAYR